VRYKRGMRSCLVVGLVVVVGCKKEPPVVTPTTAPATTKEQDALWALAPAGTRSGMVASPRGVALLERGALALRALLASSPDFAEADGKLMRVLLDATGSPNPTLADLGFTHDQGFAVFLLDGGDGVAILPVADRDKFLARFGGHKSADGDKLGSGVCKPIDGRYLCADHGEVLARLGHSDLQVTLRTAGARGDLELAGRAEPAAGLTVAMAVQLERGAFVVRGTVSAVPPAVTAMIGAPSKPRAGAAAASAFGVLDLSPYLTKAPPLPVTPGVTLAELARTVAGPVTFTMPAGATDAGIRIPLSDPAPARAVLDHCPELPPLAQVGATLKDGACRIPVPNSGGFALELWVEGKELRIGSRAGATPRTIAPSPLAAELAAGEWSAMMLGRGTTLTMPAIPGLAAQLRAIGSIGPVVLRALMLFNELGIAVRRDGDALRFVVGLRTAWANPDAVVDPLLAISADDLTSGKALERGKAIAARAPGTLFADDLAAGSGGMVMLTAPIGILSAVAIPAFMDYMKRSKKSEASIQLNRVGKSAKRAWAETGAFPKGDTGPPGGTCCGRANNHCPVDPARWQHPVWKELDFQIDEPSLFQYTYRSDGKTFLATAVGDLDCDGIMITYELRGRLENGEPRVELIEPPPGAD